MLNKCANPGCEARFRKLEDGKLFVVEIETSVAPPTFRANGVGRLSRQLEHHWLCDSCASVLTLSFDAQRGVVAVPLAEPTGRMPAVSEYSRKVAGTPLAGNSYRIQAARGGFS